MNKLQEFVKQNKEIWKELNLSEKRAFIRNYKRSQKNPTNDFQHIKEILPQVLENLRKRG